MGQRLPDALTPITLEELLPAYWSVWLYRLRGSTPPIWAIEIFAAQWAIETWWGKSCHCWNLGNAKAIIGGVYDWTFFECGEELPQKLARSEAVKDPTHIKIRSEYVLGGKALSSVKVYPDHPWSCFRAFESLVSGAADHLELLHRRFPNAFAAAREGNAFEFSVALKRAGYYTASVEQYTKGILGCLPRVKAASKNVDWDACPQFTPWQIGQVEGIIALSAGLTDEDWDLLREERDKWVMEPTNGPLF